MPSPQKLIHAQFGSPQTASSSSTARCTLESRKEDHHSKIRHRLQGTRIAVWQNVWLGQELRVAQLHGGFELIEDDVGFSSNQSWKTYLK